MRRFLAILGLIMVTAGFVLIPLSILYKINFLIPIGLILASFLILLYVKKMPSELDDSSEGGSEPPASEASSEETK